MAGGGSAGGNSTAHGGHENAIAISGSFVVSGLAMGLICKLLLKGTRLPYTVLLLLLGIGVGSLVELLSLGDYNTSVAVWTDMDPHMLLYIFLPPLIFESAFSVGASAPAPAQCRARRLTRAPPPHSCTDYHVFRHSLSQMLILAGPGVAISTLLTAGFSMLVFGYDWGPATACTFGAMLSATDPVAVVALLAELGAPKRLGILIEGESLFNDGTALVLITVAKVRRGAGDGRTRAHTHAHTRAHRTS